MHGKSEKRTRRLFGLVYFLCSVAILSATVFLLSSEKTTAVLNFVFASVSQYSIAAKTENAEKAITEKGNDVHEITSAENKTEQFSDAVSTRSDEYETPSDLEEMEADYLAVFAMQDADGDVLEDDFSTSGATDQVGFSSVRNATATKMPDFDVLLAMGAELNSIQDGEPLVLIYHTHTSESYLLSDTGAFWSAYETHTDEQDRNMIRVGTVLKEVLENAGIGVIHDTAVYDEGYDGAYARSREGIEKILAEYPSVQIVLDVHRDAFYYSDTSRGKPVVEIDGKKAAQIMIISGAEEGQITDFPNWEYNLRFALELQNTASELYEGLMRPLYFCQRKYNMDITKNSLLLEIGTDANTLDEALYAAHLCANALVKVIENHK